MSKYAAHARRWERPFHGRHSPSRQRLRRLIRAVFSVHGLTLHQHIRHVGDSR